MAEHEFDIVIIGAGHNSLVAANYLARCGLSVVLLERKLEAGGGLISEELTVPGYWNNTASYVFDDLSIEPTYRDLELDRFNVRYLRPEVQASLLLGEGRALSLFSEVEPTCGSIGRFSERDARAYRELAAWFEAEGRGGLVSRLRVPPSDGLVRPEDGRLLELAEQTPRQAVESMFESEPLRALILTLLALQRGVGPDYAGMGWTVPLLLDQLRTTSIVAGGSHVLAQALLRALVRAGGRYHVLRQVSRVLVEDGATTGVELADGTRYRARRAVVSGVDVWQTVDDLAPTAAMPAEVRQEVQAFRPDEFALFQLHLSTTEPPRYAGQESSEADEALRVVIGPQSAAEVSRRWEELRAGRLPSQPWMVCSTPTLFDPRQAPPGRHTPFLAQLAPYRINGQGPEAWREARDRYAQQCLAWWQARAPNLRGPVVEWHAPLTPFEQGARLVTLVEGGLFMGRNSADQVGSRRPTPTLSGYRTPVEGLYLCGGSSHPGLGVLGGAGYVAASVVADDLKLQKWWGQSAR